MDYLLNKKLREIADDFGYVVLNLIINGLPSKLKGFAFDEENEIVVLNLIINGLPSKQNQNYS